MSDAAQSAQSRFAAVQPGPAQASVEQIPVEQAQVEQMPVEQAEGAPGQPEAPPGPLVPSAWRLTANRIAVVYLLLAVGLLPWLVVLAVTLPDRQINHDYRLAWVGFDVLLLATLSRTAWLSWRRSPYVVIVASMTSALLIADAWFDVTTSGTEHERYFAIFTAVMIELPLAAFSMRLARRAQRVIAASRIAVPRGELE